MQLSAVRSAVSVTAALRSLSVSQGVCFSFQKLAFRECFRWPLPEKVLLHSSLHTCSQVFHPSKKDPESDGRCQCEYFRGRVLLIVTYCHERLGQKMVNSPCSRTDEAV